MQAQMKIKEAIKLTGKSRTAILRAIQDGKVSAKKDDSGAWDIDAVELSRVYDVQIPEEDGVAHTAHVRAHPNGAHRTGGGAQGDTPEIAIENATLRAELKSAQQLIEDRGKTIEDLRTRLDRSEDERSSAQTKLTALITDMRVGETNATQNPVERPRTRAGFWVALGVAIAAVAAFVVFLAIPELRGLVAPT
jgi:hypothetical protein